MKFTISVLALNNLELTKRCLSTVLSNSEDFELILTDNGSTDGVREFFDAIAAACPNVRVVHNSRNLGFEEPNKRALDIAKGEFFVLLNNDTEVPAGWLNSMEAAFLMNPKAALVGVEGGCCELQDDFRGRGGRILEYIEGACLMGRTELLRKHGLFADYLRFAYGEDSDLSLRMRRLGYTIHAVRMNLVHHRSRTSMMVPGINEIAQENHNVLCRVWAPYIRARRFDFPIVIRRSGAFGDVLLTTAIMRRLHEEWPMCPIYYQTSVPEVLLNHPFARQSPGNISGNAWVINLDMAYENRPGMHYIDAYGEAAGLVGKVPHLIELQWTKDAQDRADALFGVDEDDSPWCALHCGPTFWPCRDWPIGRFSELAKRLQRLGWRIVLVGGDCVSAVPCDLSIIGRTNFATLGAALSKCALFIGVDSMPMHVAQAAHVPTVGIFGGSLPQFVMTDSSKHVGVVGQKEGTDYGCRNMATGKTRVDGDGSCIRTVSVDQVIEAVADLGFPGGKAIKRTPAQWIASLGRSVSGEFEVTRTFTNRCILTEKATGKTFTCQPQ
jgi:ADP-heptose:LPS heptosyltransferase